MNAAAGSTRGSLPRRPLPRSTATLVEAAEGCQLAREVEAPAAAAPDAASSGLGGGLRAPESRVARHGVPGEHVDGGPSGLELRLLRQPPARQPHIREQPAVAVDAILARVGLEGHARAGRGEALHA